LIIEEGVSFEQRCDLMCAGKLVVGKNSTISFDVMITDLDHEYQEIGIKILKQPIRHRQTTIGENCFIGSGAKIQAGTTLGRQCIIGSNAVVRGSYPDYSVIVGAPAKIVKRYCSEECVWKKTNPRGEFVNA
jgi:acetyltransferase-like isoleucine patch superfamily enzyme